jgi:hypothetical protein
MDTLNNLAAWLEENGGSPYTTKRVVTKPKCDGNSPELVDLFGGPCRCAECEPETAAVRS